MIDKATVAKIQDAADIVEVVSDYVHLTRRGANYMGLCPFHNERTPSFSVSPRRNFCYCFSCHKGGSPVNFIMEKEGISYHDALLQLAKKYGIKVEERELSDKEKEERSERESLMVAAEWAMKQMESDLRDTGEGRDVGLTYLYGRGVTDEAIKAFHLGYAIDKSNHLTPLMKRAGFETEVLRRLGLTGVAAEGREYDKYRGRVIFPIFNPSGKIVAFGGRDLKGGIAKYINSPESILYSKSSELYGIFQAKSEIVRQDRCYLVEGYLDVIGMWQSGMKNVVASSGTALTDGQIALIHRFTDNVTLIYDGDSAGIKAALRGVDMLLRHKLKVSVIVLPDGHDPDSFARANTPEHFRKYIEGHQTDFITFKTNVLMKDAADNPSARAEAIGSVVNSIANIPDKITRQVYLSRSSRILGIDEATLKEASERARRAMPSRNYRGESDERQTPGEPRQNEATSTSQAALDPTLGRQLSEASQLKKEPLQPLERRLIWLAVRYGFLPMHLKISEEEDEQEEYLDTDVVGFIADELEADDLQLSVELYRKAFGIIRSLTADFERRREEIRQEIERVSRETKEKERAEIAAKGLSVAEIRIEEQRLEERVENEAKEKMLDFCRHFASDILVNHEDDGTRLLATELVNDREPLSAIFFRDGRKPFEDSNLEFYVPRAMNEYKAEIFEMEYKRLQSEIARLEDEEAPMEDIFRLQRRLMKLSKVRLKLNQIMGDRVIDPRFVKVSSPEHKTPGQMTPPNI